MDGRKGSIRNLAKVEPMKREKGDGKKIVTVIF